VKKYLPFVPLIAALVIVGVVVLVSNLLLTAGRAEFSAGPNGDNRLSLTGPAGWYCVTYTREPIAPNSKQLVVSSKGINICPLFGPLVLSDKAYPVVGAKDVPLEQPILIYRNSTGTYEVYVLISRDRTGYDALSTP
jgi:hypothetical protein